MNALSTVTVYTSSAKAEPQHPLHRHDLPLSWRRGHEVEKAPPLNLQGKTRTVHRPLGLDWLSLEEDISYCISHVPESTQMYLPEPSKT